MKKGLLVTVSSLILIGFILFRVHQHNSRIESAEFIEFNGNIIVKNIGNTEMVVYFYDYQVEINKDGKWENAAEEELLLEEPGKVFLPANSTFLFIPKVNPEITIDYSVRMKLKYTFQELTFFQSPWLQIR